MDTQKNRKTKNENTKQKHTHKQTNVIKITKGNSMRMKQTPRDDEEAIRAPVHKMRKEEKFVGNQLNGNESHNKDEVFQRKPMQIKSFAPRLPAVSSPFLSTEDLDAQIRASWVRGSVVEVYSRGLKKWQRGIVAKIFADTEGEWLEVRYNKLHKELPRDSPDIRPLRARFKNRFKITV